MRKQMLFKALEKTYNETREHRSKCDYWRKEIRCLKCGYGLQNFIKKVLEKLDIKEDV